ncbi:integral membrane sensor signal transduction histidine kinase [Ancylobacter novellus DSM 506]|uniref:histidine kinase n=1 Tax=Ancylobacter novellus (strain ATCC 8093 / DSM 506 / JCM 20403 / CCM 1077 / IAM 12100 / NBRC 12443 / NCIMB 10456) TaxID=639283 RepID=D7A0W8_ANCN5|nr:ATP-binding protein [Ancylobacter novellus]ADH87478.1 integral membrane sensor signal transduction histidine kinase [Ancylobacter novellus DSM 506]
MRLGLLARIILIVAVALFAIQLLALFFYFGAGEGRRTLGEGSPSLSRQVASLVLLVDKVPADLRPALLEAFSENGRTATIVPALPDDFTRTNGLIRIERSIRAALALRGAEGRQVWARLEGRSESGRGDTLSVYVELADGGYLWLDVEDRVTVRLLGVPIGFFAGLFGVIVALAALVAVAREMRPITRLAREVDRVGEGIDPVAIPERGAPELRKLIRAVNAMQKRIAALVRNRTLTLGAISHDLRTYLTRLRLRVEMMPESRHRAGAIADVEAMQALVADTLDFAQDSFVPTEPVRADLATALRRYAAEQNDARIVLDVPDGPVHVAMGDKALGRVVANLVGNALRYGERAFAGIKTGGARVVLVIEDEGPGIPAEERERVFEPFHRLEASRNRDSGGTGLGLTIVRRLVERHGGSIELGTSRRGGLAVRVMLPRTEPPA